MEPQISIGSGLMENEKWNEYCHQIMKISHRFSLITALCLLAGISRGKVSCRRLFPESLLSVCWNAIAGKYGWKPACRSFRLRLPSLLELSVCNAATPAIVWLDRKKGIGTILLADRGWISVIFGPTIMGIDKKR